ncbi:hypothetical protein B0H19DRAFT_965467, partial [Mycena capillaripes]
AFTGYWLTDPLNNAFGRKKPIFIACLISFLTCLWSSFTTGFSCSFQSRIIPHPSAAASVSAQKSATVPIYSAECAPGNIRGALVMVWQM